MALPKERSRLMKTMLLTSTLYYIVLLSAVNVHGFHSSLVCRRAAALQTNQQNIRQYMSATAEIVKTIPVNQQISSSLSDVPMGWECNEEAECVQIPACDEERCQTSLDVRIHNTWYDLSGWRKAHPAGPHWIDWYDGRDATEVMDAFHTAKGREMYKRLPKSTPANIQVLSRLNVPEDSSIQIAFRQLRDRLEADGWWNRDLKREATLLAIWFSLCVGAALTASTLPVVSIVLASLAFTNAGWLGHDYVHGVDAFSDEMRLFAAYAAGLGVTWWSDKHNKHHALTNEMGVDEDLATDPFLYQWAPDPKNDSPLRKIQHYTFWIPFSFLFALWRLDSIKVSVDAVEEKRPKAKHELYAIMAHYLVVLSALPIHVFVPAVLLSGFMSAMIVTPTHQNEEYFSEYQPDWVTAQFLSTRNAVMSNPFSEWLWGGMQYQLEHHCKSLLFSVMKGPTSTLLTLLLFCTVFVSLCFSCLYSVPQHAKIQVPVAQTYLTKVC